MTAHAFINLAISATVAASTPQLASWAASSTQTKVPFTILSSGGSDRIVIDVAINGHRFPMMAHANAEFVAQLRHDRAAEFGVKTGPPTSSYGIEARGRLSSLGRSESTAASLTIGSNTYRDVPVSIFEVPQREIGMLGLGWIKACRTVFDLAANQIVLSPTKGYLDAMHRRLLANGYTAVPMRLDPRTDQFIVDASINGATKPMVVNSSGGMRLDPAFAEHAGVEAGAVVSQGYGPRGGVVEARRATFAVAVSLGSWTAFKKSMPIIEDQYGYMSSPRPTNPAMINGGELGLSFLIENQATVDFGSRVLYVKERRRTR